MSVVLKEPVQYDNSRRTPLAERAPLSAPLSLQIETASACNLKCRFCIHGNPELLATGQYRSGIMRMELFDEIVSQLKDFGEPIPYVTLHARGEPLLNPHLPEMIRRLKESGTAAQISFNTNGVLLTPELSDKLTGAGLDFIRFSIEGVTRDAYREVAGVDVDFDRMVENIRYFYQHRGQCHVHIKTVDYQLTQEDKRLFLDTFAECCDDINIEHITDTWKGAGLSNEAASKRSRFDEKKRVRAKVCARLFFACQIRFDGIVVACDSDWNEKHPFGDVRRVRLKDIWNGEAYAEMRRRHLTLRGEEIPMCRNCDNLFMSENDCIDSQAERLLEYYQPRR